MARDTIYVGLDVGEEQLSACLLDADGTVLAERDMPCESSAVGAFLDENASSVPTVIALESGSTGVFLTRELRALGHDVRILNAGSISRFLSIPQNKTDRIDARGIAHVARVGLSVVREVLLKSVECQKLRSELVLREQLIHQRVRMELVFRSLFRLNGDRLARSYSGTGLARHVREAMQRVVNAGGPDLNETVEPVLAIAVSIRRVLRHTSRRLERLAGENEVCRLLMTVPGVGPICALSFYTAIEEPSRFKDSDGVGAFFGLTPKVRQSGKSRRHGKNARVGSRMTRTHLTAAAGAFRRYADPDSHLHKWATGLAQRVPATKVRSALARKLAVMMIAMWNRGEAFDARR